MNSYQTLSAYYDRFTDDVGYEQWADFLSSFRARGHKTQISARPRLRARAA